MRALCWDVSMKNNLVADREIVLGAVSAALKDLVAEDKPLCLLFKIMNWRSCIA